MHWLEKTSIAVESVSFLFLAEAVFIIAQKSAPRGINLVYGQVSITIDNDATIDASTLQLISASEISPQTQPPISNRTRKKSSIAYTPARAVTFNPTKTMYLRLWVVTKYQKRISHPMPDFIHQLKQKKDALLPVLK